MKFDLRCSLHKTYEAKRYPKSECEACETLYFLTILGSRTMKCTEKNGFIYVNLEAK